MADIVAVIQSVECRGAQIELDAFMMKRKRATEEWIDRVNGLAEPCIAPDHGALDDRPISGAACVSAIRYTGDVVKGKSAAQRGHASGVDLERGDPGAAQNGALALVVDGGAVLLVLRKVDVIWILAGGVWIDIIQRLRPGITGQHGEAVAETM